MKRKHQITPARSWVSALAEALSVPVLDEIAPSEPPASVQPRKSAPHPELSADRELGSAPVAREPHATAGC